MKPKSHSQFERFARKIIDEYLKKLLLDRHTINIEAHDETNYMESCFRVPYLDGGIRYNPTKIARDWKAKKFYDLKHALVHELCHVLTDPLYGKATDRYLTKDELNDVRETLTDHIAMIVLKNDL